jgi:hypothetical protein
MYPVTATFQQALRASHTALVKLDAWRSGVLVAGDLPIVDGAVTVDARSKVRRVLSVSLTAEAGLWDTLAPVGTELRPKRGIRYPNGSIEWVPLGVFDVDVQAMAYGPGGRLDLTAPDRWAQVQRAKFEVPVNSVGGALVTTEMARLITEAVPGVSVTVTATSTAVLRQVVWERDRDAAVEDMGRAIGAEAFFGNDGNVVIRDVPQLASGAAAWMVDASESGVMLDAKRERNRQRTYNVVVVSTSVVDGRTPFAPVTVQDTDPNSPTRVSGPFGRVPHFYTSPLLTTTAQAQAAGVGLLAKVTGLAAQLTLDVTVNPALDSGDSIDVLLPREQIDMARPVERHVVDSVTIPLTVAGTQAITTRSTRPTDTLEE